VKNVKILDRFEILSLAQGFDHNLDVALKDDAEESDKLSI
jgi:hypothetical protein